MLKLTKTGIGLLTKQYRSVLRKCLLLNLGLFLINSILLSKSLANVGLSFNASLTDYGDGRIAMSNGGQNSPSGTVGLYLADEIHYLPLSKFGFSTIGGFLYASDGSSVMNVSAFNFASVTVLDSLVNQLDRAIGNNINSNGKYIKASNINSVTDNLIALDDALNYYYTKTEADTRYAKLSGGNTFTGTQVLRSSNNGSVAISLFSDGNSGEIFLFNEQDKNYEIVSLSSRSGSGTLKLEDVMGGNKTILSNSSFILNGSSSATGIDFATNVTAGTTNASHLATTGAVNQLLNNYYYTFRENESYEVIEFANDLRSNKKEMSSLDFMPIKSSSDLRINLIKAEDPLTFSVKTRDDSLVLMEVCHA